jgi:hypothetical protein
MIKNVHMNLMLKCNKYYSLYIIEDLNDSNCDWTVQFESRRHGWLYFNILTIVPLSKILPH